MLQLLITYEYLIDFFKTKPFSSSDFDHSSEYRGLKDKILIKEYKDGFQSQVIDVNQK
jgi:hypothetical protein